MELLKGARQVIHCRVCGKDDWQDVVSFGHMALAGGFLEPATSYEGEPRYPLGVISCRSCRLMSLTHVVDPEILYRTYPYSTPESVTLTRHMRHVVEACRGKFAMAPGSLVTELGSNTGLQLMAFRDAGMRVLGIDPARNIAAVASQRGIETLPEFFSAATATWVRQRFGAAKLILGRHVFAHIDDLGEVVAGVRELLAPDGIFAIEVPYAVDLLERNEFDTIYHEHLSYFAIRSLVRFFQQHGMSVVDVERPPVHGGSILVFAAFEGRRPQDPVVGELLALEHRTGLGDDALYQRFARNVERVTRELTGIVAGLIADGKRVAGYGAPAKGNTLLNVCGFGPGSIEFCCDTTPLKQGKVLPGTHIPVWSPEKAAVVPPDYYLLLAWNYAEEIISREQAFLERGGRFIVPIPEPAVISAETVPAGMR